MNSRRRAEERREISLSTVQRELAKYRKSLPSPLDQPWNVGLCMKYNIPSTFVPELFELQRLWGDRITIREARWLAHLRPMVQKLMEKETPYNTAAITLPMFFIYARYVQKQPLDEAIATQIRESFKIKEYVQRKCLLVIAWQYALHEQTGALTHAFARIARQAGLEGVRFHDLRHTFASLIYSVGQSPK